ncbi:hypothetical protein [Azoarcus olearius]|uniref:Hypothetical membrane protein n=1 Tax=Azoarcus sp. (strain BH72) TaxID=418699 RepID=A1K4L2_AZOSB|nr:hypothetical protein [Azoarcus olearius]CAL93767.1 hypothetical membrane protein [Azoarcus olearius]
MIFDVSVALTWILFLALFPVSFYWLRRAWRIVVRRDFSEVALKRGESPPNPARFAPYAAAINLVGAGVLIAAIIGVVTGEYAYETWSAMAGSTLWFKVLADFILARHAHPVRSRKRAAPAGQ